MNINTLVKVNGAPLKGYMMKGMQRLSSTHEDEPPSSHSSCFNWNLLERRLGELHSEISS